MLTLRDTFKYQGDVSESPFARITLTARFPVFAYVRMQDADVSVSRRIASWERAEVELALNEERYRISAATSTLVGTDADTLRSFLTYTSAALEATSINDLSIAIPVHLTSSGVSVGEHTLNAIYLIKNLRHLLGTANAGLRFTRTPTPPDMAAVAAFLDKNVFLVNQQAVESSLLVFKKLAERNDDWLLLTVIQEFVDEADIDPRSPVEFTESLLAILDRIIQAHDILNPEELVRFVARNFSSWLDFPIVVPEIKSVVVAGVFRVNTPDGSEIADNDLFFYDLSLAYVQSGPAGAPVPRTVHYDWKAQSATVSENGTSFRFSGPGVLIPASVVGTVTVSVKAFDGTELWVREFDPNDPALKDVLIEVSQARPTTLKPGATAGATDTSKRLRGQVVELTKQCPLKDLTVVIQAKRDGDKLWRVVAAAETDASGRFSMPYPYGEYTEAQALVSLSPDTPADIPIIREGNPRATISDDFLYLLVTAPKCDEPDASDDRECDAPKKAPRLPAQADLVNSSAYTQDIGGSCVNLSTPNRTLSEFCYRGIVRTSDPDVVNYTLVKQPNGSFELKGEQKRITRAPVDLDNPIRWQDAPDARENLSLYQSVTVATGHVLHYKAEFRADGYSLGDLLYSLALAPGQKKQIVVMDSAYSLRAAESQNIAQGESLAASLMNERTITNQLAGNINEAMRGSSSANTSGVSAGLGLAASYGGMIGGTLGVAGGSSSSSASAAQSSARDTSMFFGERLRQSIMQNAESYRQLNASVVTAVTQGQQYSVTTDVVANHNHCHALTMMYFEVLRHFAIFQELVNVEECIFVPLLMTNFTTENIYKWSDVLARNLLPMSSNTYLQPFPFLRYRTGHPLIPAFDANERKKTNYAHVDFPAGAYCAEPITSVGGYLTIRVHIPRPKTVFDRILSFPVVKREETHNRNGGGIFGHIVDVVIGKRDVSTKWEERVKFTDQRIIIYDNFQEARPADVIEVVKFDNFFEGNHDERLWTAIAFLCGFSDVNAFLENYFAHKTISQWDSTFNDEIAPKVLEALLTNTITIVPFSSLDLTPTAKYHGGSYLMRLSLRASTSLARNHKDLESIRINYIKVVPHADEFWAFITLSVENVSITYTTKHYEGYILNKYIGDDLFDNNGLSNPPIPTPMNSDEQRNPRKEDDYLVLKLIEHLNSNLEHYNKTLWYNLDPDRRYMLLDGFSIQVYNDFGVPTAMRSLASVVKNELLTITGNSLVFPVAAGYKVSRSFITEENQQGETENVSLLDHYKPSTPFPPYRVSVPSKGVFLEAVQGACDACERVKENSSQDWTRFQTDEPTPIQPVTTPVPTITDWKAVFKEFAPPLINIQNAPPLPAPAAGLTGLTELLGKAGIFKDITGLDATQQNVLRTYLSNQENAKAFAEMAKSMVMQEHNTQHSDKIMESLKTAKDGGAINQDEYGKLVKDHIQKQIDGGDAQNQQAAQQRKQQDLSPIQSAVGLAQRGSRVSATESDADGTTRTLEVGGNAELQNVGDSFARRAWSSNQLVGLVGERLAVRVLKEEGHIVFTDWRKHISGPGIDLISLDPVTGELWVIDNKAQFRGISGADALTGPQFKGSEQQMRVFLEKDWPNKAQADMALKALDAKKVKLVVSNAFAGEKARFTKALFDKGLHAFDIRLPQGKRLFADFSAWEAAFKQLVTLRRGVRATGTRGCVTVEGSLVVAVVAAGAMYLFTAGSSVRQVGTVAAEIGLDLLLSKLPGGLFASLVIGLESDESPAALAARKREEQIDALLELVPDFKTLSAAELKESRDALKELLESPQIVEDPPETGRIKLPGLDIPSVPTGTIA
ncbi:hypothetical protein D7V97_00705 [Corallococcus sp. CA053C]|uniref:hypothetical protein n=1 Tax=Corallococcus sp. CA053C TaxID=2316732 RepID=UPI000EA22731|nr:hypothetical protein [Corallococcus sp. CA053C]RKH15357.1 hypothetical protein D7V97_00705 [Corallococcus sp. CA053C]